MQPLLTKSRKCFHHNSEDYKGIIRLVCTQDFPKKLTFLTPCNIHVRVRIRGYEMLVFRKIFRTYRMNDLKVKFLV